MIQVPAGDGCWVYPMLWAAASFDLRQHFDDDGILRKRLPEGRVRRCSRSATVSLSRHTRATRTFFPSAARVARRMGGRCDRYVSSDIVDTMSRSVI
jgi:hypothetical protein